MLIILFCVGVMCIACVSFVVKLEQDIITIVKNGVVSFGRNVEGFEEGKWLILSDLQHSFF